MITEHIYILAGLVLSLSLILTYLIKIYALKYRILDIPNERSSHLTPTPRGGGLAIVLSWYTGISILYFTGYIDNKLFNYTNPVICSFAPNDTVFVAETPPNENLINYKRMYII